MTDLLALHSSAMEHQFRQVRQGIRAESAVPTGAWNKAMPGASTPIAPAGSDQRMPWSLPAGWIPAGRPSRRGSRPIAAPLRLITLSRQQARSAGPEKRLLWPSSGLPVSAQVL